MYTKTSAALLLGALTAAASAQSSTPASTTATPTGPVVKILSPGFKLIEDDVKEQPFFGSVVSVSASVTTMAVHCAPDANLEDCAIPPGGITLTQGPTTMAMSTVLSGDDVDNEPIIATYGWECSLGGTTTAECVYSADMRVTASADASQLSEWGYDSSSMSSVMTLQLDATQLRDSYQDVTVTAGAEKLEQTGSPSGSASQSGNASASGSGSSSASGSPSGSATGASQTQGAAASVKVGGLAIGGALAAVFML